MSESYKTDPLAALKNAIDKLDNVIKDQIKNRQDTNDTVGDKQNLKLPELANTQKELAKKTDDIKNAPDYDAGPDPPSGRPRPRRR